MINRSCFKASSVSEVNIVIDIFISVATLYSARYIVKKNIVIDMFFLDAVIMIFFSRARIFK